jgi:hypothetical protein
MKQIEKFFSESQSFILFEGFTRILKATLSFLLGYENVEEEDEDDSSDEEDESHKPTVALSREAIYKARFYVSCGVFLKVT